MNHTPRVLNPILDQAAELAAQWHEGTYRKSLWRELPHPSLPPRLPVISHVTMVALLLQRTNWDDETVAAGFLHDILEDPNPAGERMHFDELAHIVGSSIAERVQWVTEPQQDENGHPLPWRIRKEIYLRKLIEAPDEARAISLSDKLHNLFTMNEALRHGVDIFTSGPNRKALSSDPHQQLWFYQQVYAIIHEHASDARLIPLLEDFKHELTRFTHYVSTHVSHKSA